MTQERSADSEQSHLKLKMVGNIELVIYGMRKVQQKIRQKIRQLPNGNGQYFSSSFSC
jgi:hypothetical protein